MCGCRGRCYLGPPPSAVAATDADSEDGDMEGVGGESDGGKESDEDASGRRAGSGGGAFIGNSCEGDSGVLGWFLNDSDSDNISVTGLKVSFEVEGPKGGWYSIG